MGTRPASTWFLVLLALVFTVGLTFATVELPYAVDGALQSIVRTPGLDSHSTPANVLKTELFISHFRLRLVGYACFLLVVAAIGVGFATRRTGFAVLGSAGLMLPVFAQFASVMFFLSGLGLLNIVWLPVLDISSAAQQLGLIVRAPYDIARSLLALAGVNGYWPLVVVCIGGGLLVFFLSTLAWLQARARGNDVVKTWLYRFSRHPQYLGWILWSYGVFLLLQQQRYPKRSWGLDASLPWMLATMVVIGVAMLEELKMSERFGADYESYRRRTPFLLPLPVFVNTLFRTPQRLMFGRDTVKRRREVVAVLAVYTTILIALSIVTYGGGARRLAVAIGPARAVETMDAIARGLDDAPDYHAKRRLAGRLAAFGDTANSHFVRLLDHDDPDVRSLAVAELAASSSEDAFDGLVAALGDSTANVRGRAARALGVRGDRRAVDSLLLLLEDPEDWVRTSAIHALAALGSDAIIEPVAERLESENERERAAAVESLGMLASVRGSALVATRLDDPSRYVRRAAVVALLQIGTDDAHRALATAVDDDDWETRVYAREAVKRLGKSGRRR